MKNLITIILSVLLSVLAVWVLLPEMEKYYAQKNVPVATTTQQQTQQTQTPEKPKSEQNTTATPPKKQKEPITAKITSTEGFYVRYSLSNNTNKNVKDITVRIFYYNKAGEQIHYEDVTQRATIAPGLSKSFERWKADEAGRAYRTTIQVLSYKN
ncbi:MAG: hypothetical protein IJ204_01775 [Paludibacteraceae bacterium]|nr:hypothetical protein [Paludibacteraceae bacterium]